MKYNGSCRFIYLHLLWQHFILSRHLLNLILPKIAESSITHPIQFKLPSFSVSMVSKCTKSSAVITSGLIMTLTFDLKTYSVYHSLSLSARMYVVKLSQASKVSCSQIFGMHTQSQRRNASSTILKWHRHRNVVIRVSLLLEHLTLLQL